MSWSVYKNYVQIYVKMLRGKQTDIIISRSEENGCVEKDGKGYVRFL